MSRNNEIVEDFNSCSRKRGKGGDHHRLSPPMRKWLAPFARFERRARGEQLLSNRIYLVNLNDSVCRFMYGRPFVSLTSFSLYLIFHPLMRVGRRKIIRLAELYFPFLYHIEISFIKDSPSPKSGYVP